MWRQNALANIAYDKSQRDVNAERGMASTCIIAHFNTELIMAFKCLRSIMRVGGEEAFGNIFAAREKANLSNGFLQPSRPCGSNPTAKTHPLLI